MAEDTAALIARITTRAPDRSMNEAVARALGWTTGPNSAGYKVVQPTGYIGGMVVPPREATAPADAWFDPKGRERGLTDREDSLPAFLTSLDAALGAAPFTGRADLLRRALDAHGRWMADTGKDDAALGRLPAFVLAEVLGSTGV